MCALNFVILLKFPLFPKSLSSLALDDVTRTMSL